jgi:hypothetical protein
MPVSHLDQSIGEVGRALDELRMAGVAMNTTVLGARWSSPGRWNASARLIGRRAPDLNGAGAGA